MSLLNPSAKGLQILLDICQRYAQEHGILFNLRKTACMIINTPHMKLKNTKVSLNSYYLEYVTSYRYLGFCIHECNDDQNIKRQLN